jgi:hypothetical protein
LLPVCPRERSQSSNVVVAGTPATRSAHPFSVNSKPSVTGVS